MLALPAIPAAVAEMLPVYEDLSGKIKHKFTLSLNLYSFNQLLQKGEIDLFGYQGFLPLETLGEGYP